METAGQPGEGESAAGSAQLAGVVGGGDTWGSHTLLKTLSDSLRGPVMNFAGDKGQEQPSHQGGCFHLTT